MNNRAFTLLELLVVITIIGILSSIVIVSMSGSTDSATIAKGKAYAQQIHALLGASAVGVWNFDEGTMDTCSPTQDACDISGYNNHGTFMGDTHYVDSDIGGYALSFDGAGDYVNCGNDNSLGITGDITIASWVKAEILGTYMAIVGKCHYREFYLQKYSNDRIYFYHGDGTNYESVNSGSSNTLELDRWYFVVAVRNTSNKKIYIYFDGILKRSDSYSLTPKSSSSNMLIGYDPCASQPWNGFIDEIYIYSEILNVSAIQNLYVQGLNNLLANQAITEAEYDQRVEEFNQSLVQYEE
jgi:prepilin-type N-terminal cleavage/methylation domain-containing protein